MVVLTILLILGVSVVVLLACLKGFGRAFGHKKVSGLFVSVEAPTLRKPQGLNKTLIDFSRREMTPSKDPAPQRISSHTVALVGMAIILGSRSTCGDPPARSSNPEGGMPGRRAVNQLRRSATV